MIIKSKSGGPIALETIAFADIVVNLFVFFFITFGLYATFDATQRGTLPIELPKADGAAPKNQAKPLIVMITRKGAIHLGSEKISINKLKESINRQLAIRKDKNVILRADRMISLEKFVSVLDVVRTTKARSVSIETEI